MGQSEPALLRGEVFLWGGYRRAVRKWSRGRSRGEAKAPVSDTPRNGQVAMLLQPIAQVLCATMLPATESPERRRLLVAM